MRLTVLISAFIIVLSSCRVGSKSGNTPYGGIFGFTKESISIASEEIKFAPSSAEIAVLPQIYPTDSLRKPVRGKSGGLLVDSIPPDSLKNCADSVLLRAQKNIERFEKQHERLIWYEGMYVLVATPILIFYLMAIAAKMQFAGLVYQILWMFLAANAISLWILGIFIIVAIVFFFKSRAKKLIQIAPQFAPLERRIEYEVRSLMMLKNVVSKRYIRRKIKEIENMAQTEPYNPWLKFLPELNWKSEGKAH